MFTDKKETTVDLLSQPTTMVLMILNRESNLSDKISQATIVSLVMFGVVCMKCSKFYIGSIVTMIRTIH